MSQLISVRLTLLCCIAAALAACQEATLSPPPPPTVLPGVTPTPTLEPTPTESVVQLSLWLPESLAPMGNDPAARILRQQIEAFGAQQPDATITIAAKKDSGPGGLLDLLRAASPVAPAVLPDIIALSDADLAIAAREGLIQPLDDWLDPQTETGLFTFARNAARIDGKRMGMPFVADFDHIVFAANRLDTRAVVWSELISDTMPYPFSFVQAGHVSDAVLADYGTLGGTIINSEGQPALTLDALTRLLTLYHTARVAGVVPTASQNWAGPDSAWIAFRTSDMPLALVRASRYLRARAGGLSLGFASMPSIDGRPTRPIGRSWNLAIVTRDPRRQAIAAALIAYLCEPDNAAAWTQAQNVLPAASEALERWNPSGGYAVFARGELSQAAEPPSPAAIEAISPAFLAAIRDVLAGRATPTAAAEAAVESVRRGGN